MTASIKKSKILVCVLNMGLGHASRCLPVIQDLKRSGAYLTIASSGRSLIFLKQEIEQAGFLELPDYELSYSNKGVSILGLIRQVPVLLKKIRTEHQIVGQFVASHSINLVISDHRYGCYAEGIPSLFITHQLRFIAPKFLRGFEFIGAAFNRHYHKKYNTVIIPDLLIQDRGVLSGRLSKINGATKYFFCGPLSSISRSDTPEKEIDLLVSISGPEPQRSVFEEIIREQIQEIEGERVVLLGKPERSEKEHLGGNLTIIPHASRSVMAELFNKSKLIVTRSGYSTVMELAETGKKALFVPTPGQTEQLYLAERFKKNGWFYSVEQDELDLKRDIRIAMDKFSGFPREFSTHNSVVKIRELLQSSLTRAMKDKKIDY